MNKKVMFYFFLSFLLSFNFYAEEKLGIATILVYDSNNQIISPAENPENKIYQELQMGLFSSVLSVEKINPDKAGNVYTALDAHKVCAVCNCEYLLYGFIQKNENFWHANLKLYSYSKKKIVKEFFGSDELEKYNRFFDSLTSRIKDGLFELTGIQLSFDNEIPFDICLSMNIGYWNPIDKNWKDKIAGVINSQLYLDFIPQQKKLFIGPVLIYFSTGLKLSYLYGTKKENVYPLNYNAFQIIAPASVHFSFNKKHSAVIHLAPYYELDFLNVIQKYEKEKFYFQNMFGFEIGASYEFSINELFSVFAETDFDFHFSKTPFIAIKPSVGAKINFMRF